jgi:hypothetical protein
MAKTSVSIEIARPPAAVFAYMTDLTNMTVWTDMQRMDLNGPLAAGTTGELDLPMMGRRTFPFLITAFDKDRRWAIRLTNWIGVDYDYLLTPTAAGTRIDQGIEVRPKGILRPLGYLLAPMMRGEELGELKRLKAVLEAPPAAA